jgi:predicted nucleotide-binding protein
MKPPPQQEHLTADDIAAAVFRLQKRIEDLRKLDINKIETGEEPELKALANSIDHTLIRIFGARSFGYTRYVTAKYIAAGSIDTTDGSIPARVNVQTRIAKAIAVLEGARQNLLEDLDEELVKGSPALPPSASPKVSSRKVFVVHGHDEAAREAVARLLERLDLKPIILNEQVSLNQTIIEKIESYGRDVGFAVVLLTPDDVGGKAPDAFQPRARQNVILELGYFVGKLGRDRVCALKKGEVEVPSDYDGVVYTLMDNAGGWKFTLANELHAAGIEIDFNKLRG